MEILPMFEIVYFYRGLVPDGISIGTVYGKSNSLKQLAIKLYDDFFINTNGPCISKI